MSEGTRKHGSEYASCGCMTNFYFDPFEIYEQELCTYHYKKSQEVANAEKA